jgi:hypothetical protein
VSDTDEALKALLRLQKKLIGRGSGASCCTDVKIVKIREDFKTIKDALSNLVAERDEARRLCCEHAAMDESGYVKHGTMLHFAESRGWDCFKDHK